MQSAQDLMWTSIWLMGILLVGVFALIIALKLRGRPRKSEPEHPFTLGQLRRLRDEGEITEAEFQSMRAAMLRQIGARVPDTTTPPPPPLHEEHGN
jgi:hypothetical protein